MSRFSRKSVLAPIGRPAGRLIFEVARRAQAMGLADSDRVERQDLDAIRSIASRAERAGIAAAAAAELRSVAGPTDEELVALLQMMVAALEASPVPKYEWTSLSRVLEAEQLASLVDVSLSSLKRYQSGERDTPDRIAARLHLLALLVGDLAGSYNHIGIRRWFSRPRTRLDGRSPADVLAGDWDPEDEGPARVRQLARELVSLSAT